MRQIPLSVQLKDSAVFDTFVAGRNVEAVTFLQRLPRPRLPSVWLWGPAGSGRSHLLQAACAHYRKGGADAAYLPLAALRPAGPGVLDGWERAALVCVDDMDEAAGRDAWEHAVFRLFNAVTEAGGTLCFAASAPPSSIPVRLADLQSRLTWGVTFQLRPLDDEERLAALRLRARYRGLDLPEETARYMLTRLPRDMSALLAWLDRLDTASLQAQRRLTLPFVRSVLNGEMAARDGAGRLAGVSEAADDGDEEEPRQQDRG
jgi:DnaA family protein